jgi:ABC-type glycerol-3-phosphate transport system substrate-binding protein
MTKKTITRRKFLSDLAAVSTGAVAGAVGLPAWAQQKSSKTGTVRVWGEPGPYGGVAVDAMNEWAKKFAPGLTFKLETLSWDSVYVKLMTDLAARNPAHCISVESPIAYQLMADLPARAARRRRQKVGRNRLIDGVKWEYWGAWQGKQYVFRRTTSRTSWWCAWTSSTSSGSAIRTSGTGTICATPRAR